MGYILAPVKAAVRGECVQDSQLSRSAKHSLEGMTCRCFRVSTGKLRGHKEKDLMVPNTLGCVQVKIVVKLLGQHIAYRLLCANT